MAVGFSMGGGPVKGWRSDPRGRHTRCRSSSQQAAASSRAGTSQGVFRAALISSALSACGDLLAQTLANRAQQSQGLAQKHYDWVRTVRMAGFGLAFYGPYQYHWYNLLDRRFPTKSVSHFLSKVTLNQLALAPVVLTVVFAWNLALTGQRHKIVPKIKQDLGPTMVNGWKFWVPAASVNFWLVPLEYQVLYMSACGVLWTGYLSFASNQ